MVVMMICELCDLCDPRGDYSERGWDGGRGRGGKYPIERTKRGNLLVFQVALLPATDYERALFLHTFPLPRLWPCFRMCEQFRWWGTAKPISACAGSSQ